MAEWHVNFKRGFALNEALAMIKGEPETTKHIDGIIMFPPTNACADVTDEDSEDENMVSINNLPGSHLEAPAELLRASLSSSSDEEDDMPLINLQTPSRNCFGLHCLRRQMKKTTCR
ncbi:hypothetical protein QE152_g1969 [Popillia japonica]|uniref:Uncharacterized protein n=1 Tax=Popillia japonica TaxID=7064 RepID=A0AAW1N502_POPJA